MGERGKRRWAIGINEETREEGVRGWEDDDGIDSEGLLLKTLTISTAALVIYKTNTEGKCCFTYLIDKAIHL